MSPSLLFAAQEKKLQLWLMILIFSAPFLSACVLHAAYACSLLYEHFLYTSVSPVALLLSYALMYCIPFFE